MGFSCRKIISQGVIGIHPLTKS